MVNALKIGIAGLGTVGASLARILIDRHDKLADICGRPIEIVAVSARDEKKDRGVDLSHVRFYADPVELAAEADIDVFVELMGGEGDPALSAVRTALARGKHDGQQGPVGPPWCRTGRGSGRKRRPVEFRGRCRRWNSDHQGHA